MAIEKIDEVWEYDGSFAGFLTLVQKAFKIQQFPREILNPETALESLFFAKWLETDEQLAQKIFMRLQQRLTFENFEFIQTGFHSTLIGKEVYLLEAIEIALQTKDSLENFIGHPAVLALQKSIRTLLGEAHQFKGFVRFEYVDQYLFSKIKPKHLSLPYICPHFADRYPGESILIYDETHRLLATIQQRKIGFLEDVDCPDFATQEKEQELQADWRVFLKALTIEERINPKLQMNHLPLRFRGNMAEFNH
ncbi:putative DNA metabolism protein [Enterococcus sp. PF1-24]|uniref:TIGR03915 family putative DNA repair protein n=1 Tax=unclassified Enterococcus TaxID=2608891 RepID=UPI002475B819|nr:MULTISPECIES: TIGR03915 family putative DNA repair protein [unclassified Enterococcus]MDH6365271.1 putative DNA metabolism protein [Enterococcus sp. PFB1-1]MDH6402399.1 putative DNA metabolism protein [Enterococcus sp. PF1-24]